VYLDDYPVTILKNNAEDQLHDQRWIAGLFAGSDQQLAQ